MIENPIFIVGTERSGSNLLRAILDAHPRIAIPHPPHLFKELQPLLSAYGDLRNDRNFRRLVQDAIRLVELHFAPWDVELQAEAVFSSSRHHDLYCIFSGIYEQYAQAKNKPRWGCKSTFMVHHLDEIVRHHSAPRIIHLVRDGRDVAVSASESVFNHYHPAYVARLWREQQRLGIEASRKLPPGKFLTLRYEDLLADPEREVRRACAFLEEEYSESLLKFFEAPGTAKLSQLSESWKNLSRPLLRGNSGKFRERLSEGELLAFERIAGAELEHFGYALVNAREKLEDRRHAIQRLVDEAAALVREKTRMLRVEAQALIKDRNALRRARKRMFVEGIRWRGRLRRIRSRRS